jgi:hypothetical protein
MAIPKDYDPTWMKKTMADIYDELNVSYPTAPATVVEKTASYAVLDDDSVQWVNFDTTSGDCTGTLPLMANNQFRKIGFAYVKGGTNKVIINSHATDATKLSSDDMAVIWLPNVGDYVVFQQSPTSGFWEIIQERISSELRFDTSAGFGSSDSAIIKFTNNPINVGNLMSHNHGSYGVHGLNVTINRSGSYFIAWTCSPAANSVCYAISKNQTNLTGNPVSSKANLLRYGVIYSGIQEIVEKTRLVKNDVIRYEYNLTLSPNPCIASIIYLGQ